MTLKTPDTFVKGQLFVGETLVPPVGFGVDATALRGAAYVSGPFMVGDTKPFISPPGIPQATCMITKRSALDGLLEASPSAAAQKIGAIPSPSIMIVSNSIEQPVPLPSDVMIGTPIMPVGVTVNTGPSLFTVMTTASTTIALTNVGVFAPFAEKITALTKEIGSKFFGGAYVDVGPKAQVGPKKAATPQVSAATIKAAEFANAVTTLTKTYNIAVNKKGFDIPHPTKENHRLRYICPEGPRADVYVRGKLRNGESVIQLPEYWRELVDPESIDISLTPFGSYQELFVKEIQWGNKIVVRNNGGGPIDCSYIVFGERKDCENNISEYEGLTPDDYPGDNSEYRINDN